MFRLAGKMTLSMMCTTPLLACTSVAKILDVRLRPSVMVSTPAGASILNTLFCNGVMALPKAANAVHLRHNWAAASLELSAADLQEIERHFAPPQRKLPLSMR